ncbi:2-amino-4-hydroxy-6-hydroxymethyldihydropteridine diphosphokinase [Chelativorans salis]|uniref:2-amino-4-hydroxy-6-hydroxymethyldihydropteridine pyrophosphokinase n=1 Tax=Chelativorans salis TaxID=2978478 RepID=A0ABT2LPL3_9HYPH|nr:2-amino-4-hydroxy-6-hydroxymethyldihydropteridine diphosphokinase [Chelativorans sp. EGI FJ00035]MCT7375598.1 2-amino-4-hydroxy-6-hydroxymethyldihydropteridine diphosphokinase [Chelativorans sp. EGI FJ00035]
MTGRNETRVFLGLGGNIGEPAKAMAAALRALNADADVQVEKVSSLYRTPPWGIEDQPDFLNAVAEIRTGLPPRRLLQLCLDTERALKRERRERWGPRLIDIDILVFGRQRVSEGGLVIPHPRMLERAFVLLPLAEIAPDLVVEGRRVAEHLEALDVSGIDQVSADGDWWREGV